MPDLDKIARRPGEYLAGTGVPQLTSGLVFALLGSSVLLQRLAPQQFGGQMTIAWSGLALCGLVFWLSRRVKQRAVFPRGGYVTTNQFTRSRIAGWVFAAILLVLGILGYTLPVQLLDSRLMWPGFAIAGASICLASGWQQKSPLMMWFSVYFLLLAPFLWWLPADNYARGAAMQLAVGAPVAAVGAIRLRKYLKASAPAESAAQSIDE